MTKSKEEMYAELVNFVFLIAGALLLIFAGHELDKSFLMFFVFMFVGMLFLMVRIEYEKEEST